MTKVKLLAAMEGLSPEFELEELIEQLILFEKVERRFQQLNKEEIKTHHEVKRIIQEW